MTLSIATPCQDEEDPIKWYLESCKHMYSVLRENLSEIVLVDGGSKDNTIDIIKEYQKELPIKLLERPFDYPVNQQNFALEHCTGDFVFTPDADMTWTTNLPALFLTDYFNTGNYWDFLMLFTARDAYHYFWKWPLGVNMRMHRRGPKWIRKYHVNLEGQTSGIPVCRDVVIFENSCRIKNEAALLNRGERRQIHTLGMEEEGAGPGSSDRFLGASKVPDEDIRAIWDFNAAIHNNILPNTDG